MTNFRPGHRCAFSLIEMLCVIVLLTAFGLLSGRMFVSTMRITVEAPLAQETLTRFEAAASAMRQDAWGAASFATDGSRSIHMQLADKKTVGWTIDDSGDLIRTAGDAEQRWGGVGNGASLEIDGPCVVLRSTKRSADVGGEVRFLSEVQLAELNRRPQ